MPSRSVVIDPGPIEDGHVDELDEQTGDVALVLLTHHHFDHSEVAVELRRPARAARCAPSTRRTASTRDPLVDGEVVDVDGLQLRVITTPGHTADSISLVLPAERALLSGDMVLGRGTTVVAYPDGQLGPYFDSIERMRSLAARARSTTHLAGPRPGARRRARRPGPLPRPPPPAARAGRGRTRQLGIAVPDADDEELPRQVVEIVYQDVDESLWGAAEWSVRAQLAYLAAR